MAENMAVSGSEVASVATTATQDLACAAMKPEQLQVVAGVLRERDMFAVLPIGFRKSL